MGRGKRISLDDADTLLEELGEVEPVSLGFYASVSAFISEHHDEFQAALMRGVTYEQIADLMQGHDITVSPTTLRRYLPKRAHARSETSVQTAAMVDISELSIERLFCVAVAAMHVLEVDKWGTFINLCSIVELEVNVSLDDDNCVTEISFTRHGEIFSRQADDVLVTFGDRDVIWAEIDPDDPEQSQWLYELLEQQAPELVPQVKRLADDYRASVREES